MLTNDVGVHASGTPVAALDRLTRRHGGDAEGTPGPSGGPAEM
ncbi:MAG TPA: hypothetical protein VGD43_19010 [Micromonospora sp.]